jgi:hypothetical protein
MPGAQSQRDKDARREAAIRAALPCPTCGAPIGAPCREGTQPHDARRGRRAAWVGSTAWLYNR